ncbi:MAG TPA: hypothetical protein VLH56_11740 [Dissulfurispiraceae bacterium]|nr:hypothetical protein [Dissulfurispiraceae bacterium]
MKPKAPPKMPPPAKDFFRLCRTADGYFAESKVFGVYAYGDTPEAASKEFASDLRRICGHYLRLRPDEVTGEAAKLYKAFSVLMGDTV